MAPKSIFSTMTLAANLLTLHSSLGAADLPGSVASSTTAFCTDRLSPRQMRLWNSIHRIALATDHHGRVTHPVLYGLWRAAEQSGHRIFVELITDANRCSNIAGESAVEEFDPTGRTHSLRMRLFTPTIRRAYAGEQAPKDGLEFVPYAGLGREARYAKVFGHELAHIERMLRDSEYMSLVREICAEQLAIAAEVGRNGGPLPKDDLDERWNRVWPLILDVEKPALAAEAEIYRELLIGK